MRLAKLVKLAVALWVLRWAAMEAASRLGHRPAAAVPTTRLPGRMPGPSDG